MAEGFLDDFLGGDDEAGREGAEAREAKRQDSRSDLLALSVATDLARGDPEVARHTARFMEAQAQVARAQASIATLEAAQAAQELHLRLHHLESQAREGRLRRAGQRVRLAMQVFAALVASTFAFGFLSMLYDAVTSHSVVVNAFRAPAVLAGQGLTGEVVATDILDALQHLQEATTHSPDKGLETHGAWASDIKLEVPETGVSIGEIDRLLHDRFGHDLHIDGDLVQKQAGLALTIRGDGVPASTFVGPDIGKLITQAAEYIYSRSQPLRYAVYLVDAERFDDALAFLPGAFARAGTDMDRAKLLNAWGDVYSDLGREAEADVKFRLELSLVPRWSQPFWAALDNLIDPTSGEEAAWHASKTFMDARAAAPARSRPAMKDLTNPAQLTWDVPLYLQGLLEDGAVNGGAGTMSNATLGPSIADVFHLMHDPVQSERYIAASDPNRSDTKAEVALLQGYAALDRGDAAGAIPPLEAFQKAWLASTDLQLADNDQLCFLGLAYGLVGRLADADAVFKRVGAWSRCWAFRGDVLAQAGDVAGAERAWADGLKLLPDLPLIYLHRGLFELDHGDLKAAEADLATAVQKAPHFADPLKAWGDLSAREGRWQEAVGRYDQALLYAPAWAELREARDAAVHRLQSPQTVH